MTGVPARRRDAGPATARLQEMLDNRSGEDPLTHARWGRFIDGHGGARQRPRVCANVRRARPRSPLLRIPRAARAPGAIWPNRMSLEGTGMRVLSWPLGVLLAAQFVASLGFGAVLPTLPLFVHDHGLPLASLGLMVATYSVATLVAQVVAGRLSDTFGRRVLMTVGLLLAAGGMAAFLLPGPPLLYLLWRGVWGLGSGTLQPVALAAAADLLPEEARGRGYGWMSSAMMGGIAAGPMFGAAVVALAGLAAPFFLGAPLTLLTAAAVWTWMPRHQTTHRVPGAVRSKGPVGGRVHRQWFWLNAAWMGAIGVYDTAWSIYLSRLGAPSWLIGASWTVFALPLMGTNFIGGRLADHASWRKRLVLAATFAEAVIVLAYAFLKSPIWAIAVSSLESVTVAMSSPSLNAAVMQEAHAEERGAVQGRLQAYGSAGSLALAVAAGYLLAWHLTAPFLLGGTVLAVVAAAVSLSWGLTRHQLPRSTPAGPTRSS